MPATDTSIWTMAGGSGAVPTEASPSAPRSFPVPRSAARGETSFRPLTDRLHAMGLKAGIYTDSGKNSCSQRWDPQSPNLPEGSIVEREIGLDGYEHQDLRLFFQDWGFDYVKVDACGLADYGRDNDTVVAGQYAEFKPQFTREKPEQSDLAGVETRYARIGRHPARAETGRRCRTGHLRVGRSGFAHVGRQARQPLAHQRGHRAEVGKHAAQLRQRVEAGDVCGARTLERSGHDGDRAGRVRRQAPGGGEDRTSRCGRSCRRRC